MINGKHNIEDGMDLESLLSRGSVDAFSTKFKNTLFSLAHAILPKSQISAFHACVLIALSFIQFLSLTITKDNHSTYYDKIKFSRFLPLLQAIGSVYLYVGILYLIVTFIIIYWVVLIFSHRSNNNKTSALGTITYTLFWGLMIPFTETLLGIYSCDDVQMSIMGRDLNCWTGIHLMHVIIVSVSLILWMGILILIIIACSFSNVYKSSPFNHFYWNFEGTYTVIRLMNIIRYSQGIGEQLTQLSINAFLSFAIAIYFFNLVWHFFPYYHPTVSLVFTGSAISVGLIDSYYSLFDILHSISSIQSIPETLIMVLIAICVFVMTKIIQIRRTRDLMTSIRLMQPWEIDLKVNILTVHFVTKMHPVCVSEEHLKGFLDQYKITCMDPNCPLLPSPGKSFNLTLARTFRTNTDDSTVPKFVVYLLKHDIKEKSSCISLHESRTYFHLFENIYFTALKLEEAEESDPDIFLQFSTYCLKRDIQEYLENVNEKISMRGCEKFYNPLKYEIIAKEFYAFMENSVNIRMEFWTNLRNRPNFNVLHTLGLEIMSVDNTLAKIWEKLTNMFPNFNKMRELYSNYLMAIMGLVEESLAVMRIAFNADDVMLEKDFSKNRIFSSDSISVLASHNGTASNIILKVSYNVNGIFGYTPKMLHNNSLAVLMPRIIGLHHEKLMQQKPPFDSRGFKTYSAETFGLHRNGYIFPIKVANQQIYSPKYGLIHVGNIQLDNDNKDFNYILTDEEGRIEGLTREVGELIGVNFAMITDQAIFIQYYCPELRKVSIQDIQGSYRLNFGSNQSVNDSEEAMQELVAASPITRGRRRPSAIILKSEIKTNFSSKCEIATKRYTNAGFTLKIFKFPYIRSNILSPTAKDSHSDLLSKDCLLAGIYNMTNGMNNMKLTKFLIPPAPVNRLFTHITEEDPDENSDSSSSSGSNSSSSSSANKTSNQKANEEENTNKDNQAVENIDIAALHYRLTGQSQPEVTTTNINSHIATNDEHEHKVNETSESKDFSNTFSTMNRLVKQDKASRKRESIISLRHDITSRVDTELKQNSEGRDMRVKEIISAIRANSYKNFRPMSIVLLKYTIFAFGLFLLMTLCARFAASIFLNQRFETFGLIMMYNAKRISSLGRIGNHVRQLSFYSMKGASNQTLFNDTLRTNFYDPSLLLPKGKAEGVTSYKDYLIKSARMGSENLVFELKYILDKLKVFNASNAVLVEPDAIKLTYPSSKNIKSGYEVSMSISLYDVIAYLNEYLSSIQRGVNDTQAKFSSDFLIENILEILIRSTRLGRDGIIAEYLGVKGMLDKLSFSLLIILMIILILMMVVLFPFLQVVNKELDSMLLMLAYIPKAVIKLQLNNAIDFAKILKLNNEFTGDDDFLDDSAISRKYNIYDLEEEKQELDDDPNVSENKALVQTGNKSLHRERKLAYVERKSNSWKIMLAFLFFSGSLIGVYCGYDITSTSLTEKIIYQINELYAVTRGLYYCSFNMGYVYHYTITNRTGLCGTQPCVDYITTRMSERLAELTSLLAFHKRNESLLTIGYRQLYRNIMEDNPCRNVPYFKNIQQCSTILNGVFTQGLYAASTRFILLQKGVKTDLESKILTLKDIESYINDIRLVQMEIMGEVFLLPAFVNLAETLAYSGTEMTSTNNLISGIFFSIIAFIIISGGSCGGKYVLEYLKKSIYDTKSLLSSLPPIVIESNDPIKRMLINSIQN